jgi:hypothetical protein
MDEEIKTDEVPETFPVIFKEKVTGIAGDGEPEVIFRDRKVMFQHPSEGQVAVIARAARKAERGGGKNAVEAIGLILDVIDNMVVDRDDRNWLEDGLVNSELELDDFIGVLDGINSKKEDSKPAGPAKAARSGRR